MRVQSPAIAQVDDSRLRDLLTASGAEAESVEIQVDRPPWTRSALQMAAGDQVTWLAWGAVHLVKPLGISATPSLVLAARVAGSSAIQRSARSTMTFTADRAGVLEFASLAPGGGEPRPDGSVVTDRLPYRALGGQLRAIVVRWPAGSDPRSSLEAIADTDATGLCAEEAARLAKPPAPPPGWEHHPLLAPEAVFERSTSGVVADCRQSVGIVRTPVDVPLTRTLRVRWTWRLEALASALPEDTLLTHDYLSVALEFDDGQDLTWFWSSSLPVGFAYRCPLDHWRHRETHIVARTGYADLGSWVTDERAVLADHQAAIGGPPPGHVARAWLIAVSGFQRGRAAGEFSRLELIDGDRTISLI